MPGAIVSPTQGKIDVALSQFALRYSNGVFVADRIFPRVAVANQSDLYWIFGRENQRVAASLLRAPGSAAQLLFQGISKTPYSCQDRAASRLITDEERGNFQAGNVEEWATTLVMDQILLDFEKNAATLATTLGTYPTTNRVTLSGTSQWSDFTGVSKPIDDVIAGHVQLMRAGINALKGMIVSPEVWQKLKSHPDIKARVSPTQLGPVTTENLRAIFEVDAFDVASAYELDVALATAAFTWGKHAILYYSTPTPTALDVSFGKTFVWSGAPGSSGGASVQIGRMNPPSTLADELHGHFSYDLKVTSNISAYFIQNAVA